MLESIKTTIQNCWHNLFSNRKTVTSKDKCISDNLSQESTLQNGESSNVAENEVNQDSLQRGKPQQEKLAQAKTNDLEDNVTSNLDVSEIESDVEFEGELTSADKYDADNKDTSSSAETIGNAATNVGNGYSNMFNVKIIRKDGEVCENQNSVFSKDLPIQAIKYDKLNRGKFVQGLANGLLSYAQESSLVVGLYGKWGSGKTSILNMVTEEIEHKGNNVAWIHFKPWLCSNEKQMVTEFFELLKLCFPPEKGPCAIWSLLNRYSHFVEAVPGIIPVFGGEASKIVKAFTTEAKIQCQTMEESLSEVKSRLNEQLKNGDLKIIVMIDDLDRLSDEEIVSIFKLVKSVADFPYTRYLLAFDYDIVVKALEKVQSGNGRDYLEKIVQVPMPIPAQNEQLIHDEFKIKLEAIIGAPLKQYIDQMSLNYLLNNGVFKYVDSIRNSIRLLNAFAFKFYALKGYVDWVDLLGITCLQVFEPKFYENMTQYKNELCVRAPAYVAFTDKRIGNDNLGKLLECIDIPLYETSALEQILKLLFLDNVTVLQRHAKGFLDFSVRVRNWTFGDLVYRHGICDIDCFDMYFSLTIEPGVYSFDAIKKIVLESTEVQIDEQFKVAETCGYCNSLIREICAFINFVTSNKTECYISPERAELLIFDFMRMYSATYKDVLNGVVDLLFIFEIGKACEICLDVFGDPNVPVLGLVNLLMLIRIVLREIQQNQLEGYENKLNMLQSSKENCSEIFGQRICQAIKTKQLPWSEDVVLSISSLQTLNKAVFEEVVNNLVKFSTCDNAILANVIWVLRRNGLSEPSQLARFVEPSIAFDKMRKFVETTAFHELSLDCQNDVELFLKQYGEHFKIDPNPESKLGSKTELASEVESGVKSGIESFSECDDKTALESESEVELKTKH